MNIDSQQLEEMILALDEKKPFNKCKGFLEKNVYHHLEKTLNRLLETIESSGEYDRYVEDLAHRQIT